jgi:hypothetical protein
MHSLREEEAHSRFQNMSEAPVAEKAGPAGTTAPALLIAKRRSRVHAETCERSTRSGSPPRGRPLSLGPTNRDAAALALVTQLLAIRWYVPALAHAHGCCSCGFLGETELGAGQLAIQLQDRTQDTTTPRSGVTTIFRDPEESASPPKTPANRRVAGQAAQTVSLRIPAVPRGFRTSQGVEVLNACTSASSTRAGAA